jgi:hypothetical protein
MRSLGESSHAKTRRREGVFLFQGIPKYDHPYLNVTKALVGITQEKIGTVVRPVYVSAAVTVGEIEGEKTAPGWQLPGRRFDYARYSNDLTCEGTCTLAS